MRKANRDRWPLEANDLLKQMWEAGESASSIAFELIRVFGNPPGVSFSRNAVIGKAHRHGYRHPNPRGMGPKTKRETKPRALKKPSFRVKKTANEIDIEAKQSLKVMNSQPQFTVTLMALERNMCRWPSSDASTYCGAMVMENLPYCEGHAKIAYNGIPIKKNERTNSKSMRRWG